METRTSATARIFAALAIVVAVLVVVVAIGSSLGGSSSGKHHKSGHHAQKEAGKQPRTQAKTYTVKTGDTLTSIAHQTGVPVAEILALNPEVDPQILIAGETLKLK
jgi:LysM repeat protein